MALILAFAVAVVTAPLVGRLARRVGLVDRPGPLKVHRRPVPYLGGLAVLAALLGPVAVSRPVVLVPLVAAAALGLADDRAGLPARLRLALELAIGGAVAVAVGGGSPGRGLLAVGATAALVNAVNLLDGLDGLAGGTAAVAALGFAAVLGGDGVTLALALAGGLGGFLVWNRPPARIYLGDSGSYLVGTALAVLLVDAWGEGTPTAVAALLLVGVPVADTTVAIVRRLRAGRPLLVGDRGHVYDQLVDRGRSPGSAVLLVIAAQAGLAVVAVLVATLTPLAATLTAVLVIGAAAVTTLAAFTAPPGRSSR